MNVLILLSHLMTKEGYLEIESKLRAEEAYKVAQKESVDYLITNGWNYREDCKLTLADAFSNYLNQKEKLKIVLFCVKDFLEIQLEMQFLVTYF